MASYRFWLDVGNGTWEIGMTKSGSGSGAYAYNYAYSVTINGVTVGSGRASFDFRSWGYNQEGSITLASGNYSVQTGNNNGYATYDGGIDNTSDSDSYYKAPPSYSHYIYYNANGGSGAPATQNCGSNTTINSFNATLSSTRPTRTGYTFLGWSTNSAATAAAYQPGTNYTFTSQNVTLYAVWRADYTHTITYDANGGSGAPDTQSTTNQAQNSFTMTLSNTRPTRLGCTFLGWATSATGTPSYQPGNEYTFNTQNVTLYAIWQINCYIKVNGTWKLGIAYVKVDGTWKPGIPRIKVNGAWK